MAVGATMLLATEVAAQELLRFTKPEDTIKVEPKVQEELDFFEAQGPKSTKDYYRANRCRYLCY